MAARCAVCGKGPQVGYTVSHSHIRNKRTFRVRVCVKCLKAGKVQRVVA